jgi:gliding motility-associated-like protein
VVTASVLDGVSCYSGNDGKLKAVATGGTPTGSSYTYDWNTTAPPTTGVISTLSNLETGSYVVIAIDANGCMDTAEIFLAEQDVLIVDIDPITDVNDVSCYGFDDGTITATASGGTPSSPAGNYTYVWNTGISQVAASSTLLNLSPGIYFVTVTDENGCTDTSSSVVITQSSSPLIVTADSTDETCLMDDGTAIANVFGGTFPIISYLWSPTGQTTPTATGLSPSFYTVTVTDAKGCVESASTYVNAIDAIFLPSHDPNWDTTICLNHSASISVVENPDYTYSWAGPDGFSALTPNITVTPGAPTNHYILTVFDPACPNNPNNPFDITAIVFVTYLQINPIATPTPIKVGDEVKIEATVNGYSTYIWSDENGEYLSNSQSTYVYPEVSTTYYIMVEDAGCQGYDSIRVVVGAIVYNGISPNGDGYNDFWEIEDIDRYPDAVIEVYNRWGSLLFSAKGDTYNDNKWDGTHEGSPLPIGTYYYIINLNNNSDLQSGAITIIR